MHHLCTLRHTHHPVFHPQKPGLQTVLNAGFQTDRSLSYLGFGVQRKEKSGL